MKRPSTCIPTEQMKMERSSKRDLIYSTFSLIGFPLIIFYVSSNVSSSEELINHIINEEEIPLQIVAAICCFEVFKLFVTFAMYPSYHLFDPMASATSSKSASVKLPVSRRDRDSVGNKFVPLYAKFIEFWKAVWNFGLSCGICHVFMILFGAPFLKDFLLTLQFSIILVSWLFAPLCLSLRPSHILQELPYISLWNSQIECISRAKIRFIVTVFGAMSGAALIPLDWDRPWQKWPITCIFSSAVSFLLVNMLFSIYLFFTVYFCRIKMPFWNRRTSNVNANNSKVKSY